MKRNFLIERLRDDTYSVTETTGASKQAQFARSPVPFASWGLLAEELSTLGATKAELGKPKLDTDRAGTTVLTVERGVDVEKRKKQLTERWQELVEKEREADSSPFRKEAFVPGPRYDASLPDKVMSLDEIRNEISRVQAELDRLDRWS